MIAPLALLHCAVMGVVCLLGAFSSTDPGAPRLFAQFFLLGSLSLLLPLAVSRRRRDGEGSAFAIGFVAYWAGLAVLGFLPILREPAPLVAPLVFLAWAACAADALRGLRLPGERLGAPGWAALAVAAAALLSICASWGTGYSSPSTIDQMVAGATHVDIYLHANIAAMIRDHGIPSAGIDGLPFFHYHFLSHAAFAAISKLSGSTTVQAYSQFYPSILPPLFFFWACLLGVSLSRDQKPAAAMLLTAALASGVLPLKVLSWFLVSDTFVSESYGFSLTLLFAVLFAVAQAMRRSKAPSFGEMAAACLGIGVITLAKVSVGCLACQVVILSWALRAKGRWVEWVLRSFALGSVFLIAYRVTVGPAVTNATHFGFLIFPRKYGYGGVKAFPAFLLVHWLPLWIGMAAKSAVDRPSSWKDLSIRLLRDWWFLCVIAPATLMGGVALFMDIGQQSSIYFTTFPWLVALPWAESLLAETARLQERPIVRWLAATVAASAVAFQAYPRLRSAATKLFAQEFTSHGNAETRSELQTLLTLRRKLSERPKCGLHVPRTWLWDSELSKASACWKVPQMFAGIMERPLYWSLMPEACRLTEFAKEYLHPQRADTHREPADPALLCGSAQADGLSCVDVLSDRGVERLDCPQGR